jgi:hypothetical protein
MNRYSVLFVADFDQSLAPDFFLLSWRGVSQAAAGDGDGKRVAAMARANSD